MKFCLLASGSKGNSLWVEEGPTAFLVDNGLSLSDFMGRARARGLNTAMLKSVFVTHEHTDHINGVGRLAKTLNLEVYASPVLMREKGDRLGAVRCKPISEGDEVAVGTVKVRAIKSSHDTVDPLIYLIKAPKATLGIATDLGEAAPEVIRHFQGLDAIILEFNHDTKMLFEGTYPGFLKKRVSGNRGHLSNDQAAEFLSQVTHQGLKVVVLAHLSENNNSPELAYKAATGCLGKCAGKPAIHVAQQDHPTDVFDL
ncbi:MAG: MBL fold metallo-hydrolase [Deltaproteobacteria bacterium]|jgi:phosphoribosyl 1,2-cyclic phosphodiesterase|nr:MBL fold metallo-hydrolase [Deltaproteobacteria bacterium]